MRQTRYVISGYGKLCSHHMELHDHRISLELLFTGVNFDVQLFEEDC